MRARTAARSDAQARVSKVVGPLGETIGKLGRQLVGLVLSDPVLCDEPRQKAAIDAARDIVPRRDRQKRARVVVESYRVVEARGLGRLLAEAQHALRAVVEPPRRTELKYWIVARQRRKLARVDGFVEREQNHREAGIVAEAVEQRFERPDIVGAGRDIGAL